MHKSLVSTAAALLLAFGAVGAQAQVAIANADFELSAVATNTSDTFSNLGWSNVQWGWLGGSSKIIDVGGNQMAQVVGGDVIWSGFAASSAGNYQLTFDTVGDGYVMLYDNDTHATVAQAFVQNATTSQFSTTFALTSTDNYRLYFGTTPLPPTFNGNLTIDNVAITQIAAPVPEPESYAMMLGGLGALGLMGRRRLKSRA
ncbi:PEP-CTERM sorting domain-containing protein [Sphaerotilus sp.]|uniref:PEP-CTERM sorting domain-containing protein n=1 Tax=Sphaerotilus sp. TaxID=2093942 RepID=UPI0034E25C39